MANKTSTKKHWRKLLSFSEPEFRREWIVFLTFHGFVIEMQKLNQADSINTKALVMVLPHFAQAIKIIDNKVEQAAQTQAISLLGQALAIAPFGENKLGDLYQTLKSDCAKDAFRSTLQSNSKEKLEQRKLLLATQYFTDDYISTYLLSKPFFLSDPDTMMLDPACGAGHILITGLKLKLSVTKQPNLSMLYDWILGYDLDPIMVELSKLAIFLFLRKHFEQVEITKINIKPYQDKVLGKLSEVIDTNKRCLWITNPPYAGKRDLSPAVKDFLRAHYPQSNGDLCVGFMLNLLQNAKKQDYISLIMQKSWLTLSSYSKLRKLVIDNKLLQECVDLGSNAFSALTGEKTNIALIGLNKSQTNEMADFYDLSHLSYQQKQTKLQSLILADRNQISIENFLYIKHYAFIHNMPKSLFELLKNSKSYGHFATPMQGTSTGDNKHFIDFIWNRKDDKNWVSVSKGGSFCRWFGLNSYCVKWGKAGELIRKNPGSELRNLDKCDSTELVYSDTGKLGLNARLKQDKQVFVTSGPGIMVNSGCKYAHLGFLNSNLSSYFIRKINDKLTVSAGYIASLPCGEQIVNCSQLSRLGKSAVQLSKSLSEYYISESNYTFDRFLLDGEYLISPTQFIQNYLGDLQSLKQLESEINQSVYQLFDLTTNDIKVIEQTIKPKREPSFRRPADNIEFNKLLGADLRFGPKALTPKGFGTDNLMEYLSAELDVGPSYFGEHKLSQTDQSYLYEIFVHHLVLHLSGFKNVTEFKIEASINHLCSNIKVMVAEDIGIYLGMSVEQWIKERFLIVHEQVFKGEPFVVNRGNCSISTIDNEFALDVKSK